MSSIEPDTIILTEPSGSNIGLSVNTINTKIGNFTDSLFVNGIDVGSGNVSAAAHIAATSNIHGTTSAVVGLSDTQTLTNKTIDSGSNTIQVNAVDINNLINQDVRTTAFTTFNGVNSLGTLQCQNGNLAVNQPLDLSLTNNGLVVRSAGIFKFECGHSQLADDSYIRSVPDLNIAVGGSERLRFLSTGISNDNTITNLLGLQGTTLVYKNNLIDDTLVNQDVRNVSSPTFVSPSITSLNVNTTNAQIIEQVRIGGVPKLYRVIVNVIVPASTSVTVWTSPIVSTSAIIKFFGSAFVSTVGAGSYDYATAFWNNGGVLTIISSLYANNSETGIGFVSTQNISFGPLGNSITFDVSNGSPNPVLIAGEITLNVA